MAQEDIVIRATLDASDIESVLSDLCEAVSGLRLDMKALKQQVAGATIAKTGAEPDRDTNQETAQ